jgi:hypothetical protein
MEKEIIIQRAWLEGLIRHAKRVNEFGVQEPTLREAWIAHLLGYIQSAELILTHTLTSTKRTEV